MSRAHARRSLALALPDGALGSDVRHAAEGLTLGAYRFTKYLTGDRQPKAQLERATVVTQGKAGKEAKDAVVADFERAYLAELLRVCQGNVSRAARTARIDRISVHRILQRHGLLGGRTLS